MRWTAWLLGVALVVPGLVGGQEHPIAASFTFSQVTPNSNVGRRFRVHAFFDGGSLSENLLDDVGVDFTANVEVVLDPNGNSALASIDLDFVTTPLFLEGVLDLGFDGQVPYQITVTEATWRLPPTDISLSLALIGESPRTPRAPGSVEGSISLLGTASQFQLAAPSLVFSSFNSATFDFDLAADRSSLELQLAISSIGNAFGPITSVMINGKLLEIFLEYQLIGLQLGREVVILGSAQAPIDTDGDGVFDEFDNCPDDPNPGQEDSDLDLIGDACDPFPSDRDNEQAQCELDLGQCLLTGIPDEDGDGETDSTDTCPETPQAEEVDSEGCSLDQFCSQFEVITFSGRRLCKKADWKNDEPVMRRRDRDCRRDRGGSGREDDRCVPTF